MSAPQLLGPHVLWGQLQYDGWRRFAEFSMRRGGTEQDAREMASTLCLCYPDHRFRIARGRNVWIVAGRKA